MKNNIRPLRLSHGQMTQQELADRIGVSRQTIITMEKGNYQPSVKLALKIAKVFAADIENVFQLEEDD